MYPPIFEVCSADSNVQSRLGSDPIRLFPFGEANYPNVVYPYATWQVITGRPENALGEVPDMDLWTVQIDIFARSDQDARDVAEALRDAIEPVAHITNWRAAARDPDTRSFIYSFTVDWWVSRREIDSTYP